MPSSNVTVYRAFRTVGQRKHATSVALKEHVANVLKAHEGQSSGPGQDVPYLFDTATKIPDLLSPIDLSPKATEATGPHYFRQFAKYADKDIEAGYNETKFRYAKALFGVGAAGSGTYWHDHTAAYSYQAYGQKLWLLIPPETEHLTPGACTRMRIVPSSHHLELLKPPLRLRIHASSGVD